MGKFIKVAKDKIMVKVVLDGKEQWTTCSQAVKSFAKTAFKTGDIVNIQYETKEGVEMFHVTRIEKGTGTGTDTNSGIKASSVTASDKPTCKDCGCELKDAKYEKCWSCNKKNPSKSTGRTYGKSSEELEGMRKGNLANATSRSIVALQGHVDPNSIHEYIKAIYKTYDELTK